MNEIFVLCAFCQEEEGIIKGELEFVCRRCKRTNLLIWDMKPIEGTDRVEKVLSRVVLENPTSD